MKISADQFAPFTATDDALVLASVSSPAEEELLNDWLARQRREHPDSKVDVLRPVSYTHLTLPTILRV